MAGEPGDNFSGKIDGMLEALPDLCSELLSAFDGMVVSVPSSCASASTPAPSEMLSSSSAPSEEDEIPDQDVEMVPAPSEILSSSCASASTPAPSEMLSSSPASSSTPAPSEEDEIPDQDVEMVPATAESLFSSCDSASTPFIEYESHQHEFLPPIGISPIELEEVFSDFKARRDGILKALTTDFKRFCRLCDDPEKDNLCLYGLRDGTWEVKVPPDEAPPDMPEPLTGINFCRRGGMEEKQWRSFIAAHSDAWLLAHTFLFGSLSGFGQESRKVLFEMMSDLPTMYEVVTGVDNEPTNEGTPNNSSESNKSPSQPPIPDGESSTRDK